MLLDDVCVSRGILVLPEFIPSNYGRLDPLGTALAVSWATSLVSPKCAPSMRRHFCTGSSIALLIGGLDKLVATEVNFGIAKLAKSLNFSLANVLRYF